MEIKEAVQAPEPPKLSEQIKAAFAGGGEGEQSTFGTLLDRLDQRSYAILLIILSLPSALPVPAPGYSTPFALILAPLAVQMIVGKAEPWFPQKVRDRRIKGESDSKLVGAMLKFIRFFERFSRPRWARLFRLRGTQIFLGFIVLLCALSMMIPLPLTNTVPAMGIFFIGLSLLEEDFVIGVVGFVLGGAWVGMLIAGVVYVALNGAAGIEAIRDLLQGVKDSILWLT
jgi:hypothetical protein